MMVQNAVPVREQWHMLIPVYVEGECSLDEVEYLLIDTWAVHHDTVVSDVLIDFAIDVRPTQDEAANGRISTLWVIGTAVRS